MATRSGKAKSPRDIINQHNRLIQSLNESLKSGKITREQWQNRIERVRQISGEYRTNILKSQAGKALQRRVDKRYEQIDKSFEKSYRGYRDAAHRKENDRLDRGALIQENNRDRAKFENTKFVGYQGSKAVKASVAG